MATFEFVVVLIAVVLMSAVLGQSIPRVSVPLVQIVLGIVLEFLLPSSMQHTVSSELFLVLFISPLLFNDSRRVSTRSIWKNRGSILSLAIGLVFITLLAVGFALHFVVPSIPLAAAFALGAALGPTDAVAVSSLSDEVQLNNRQKILLSGEALLNDASGVVSFQFAIAAAVTGAFSVADATLSFFITFIGGLGIGVVLGILIKLGTAVVRAQGLESTTVHVMAEVFTPFAVYLIAEAFSVSGILAVVAAGLFLTAYPERTNPISARLNVVSSSVWEVLIFLINGVVFVMLGMELPGAVLPSVEIEQLSFFVLIGCSLLIFVIVLGIRFVWIVLMESFSRRTKRGRKARLARAIERQDGVSSASAEKHAALASEVHAGIAIPTVTPFKDALITTLAGPKGAVTLSIVFTIPTVVSSGAVFPYRQSLVFMASAVIIFTLLLANFVVPVLSPKPESEIDEHEANNMRIKVYRAVISALKLNQTEQTGPATRAVIRQYRDRVAHCRAQNTSSTKLSHIREQVYGKQEEAVELAMTKGTVSREAGIRYQKRLRRSRRLLTNDGKRSRTQAMRNPWSHPIAALFITLEALFRKLRRRRTSLEVNTELRLLSVSVEEAAVRYLGELTQSGDKETARAARLLLEEHEALLATNQARMSGSGSSTIRLMRQSANPRLRARSAKEYELLTRHITAVEANALRIELEVIQRQREEHEISREVASQMRDEVYVMQMNL